MNKQSIYNARCIINKLESEGIDVNSYNSRLTDCIKFNNVEFFLGLLDELEFEERKVRASDLFKYITIKWTCKTSFTSYNYITRSANWSFFKKWMTNIIITN